MQDESRKGVAEIQGFVSNYLGLTEAEAETLKQYGEIGFEPVDLTKVSAIKPCVQQRYRNGLERREEILATTSGGGRKLLGPCHSLSGKQGLKIFDQLASLEHITELNGGFDLGPMLLLEGLFFECERTAWHYPRSIVTLGARYCRREGRFQLTVFDLGSIRSNLSEERTYSLVYSS